MGCLSSPCCSATGSPGRKNRHQNTELLARWRTSWSVCLESRQSAVLGMERVRRSSGCPELPGAPHPPSDLRLRAHADGLRSG